MLEELKTTINEQGRITREQVVQVVEAYNDPDNLESNLETFLNETTLSQDEKNKVMGDFKSYA